MQYNYFMDRVLKFDLGRNALEYVVQKYKIKEMHIPYYICDVIRHTLFSIGCKPVFYHIDDNFMPLESFSGCDYILYPNYFGVFGENVKILAEKYPRLIVDNAHAYFDQPQGFVTFNAGHKFGFKDSLLYIGNIKNDLDEEELMKRQIFYDNFRNLHEKYRSKNNLKFNLSEDYAPFVYPYLVDTVDEADELVLKLNKEGKMIYRYWNPLPKSFNEYKFYSRLVPIPVIS